MMCRQGFDFCSIRRNIPGDVQGNRTTRLIELVQKSYIFYFFFKISRLTTNRETTKPRTTGTQGPTWNGHLKSNELINHRFNIGQ